MSRTIFDLPGLMLFSQSLNQPGIEQGEMRSASLQAAEVVAGRIASSGKPLSAQEKGHVQTAALDTQPIAAIISAVPISRINGVERLGSNQADRLIGTNESDILIGKLGDDRLVGGAGNDQLTGGHGRDWLQGGPGYDRFFFNQVQDGIDQIDDFSVIFDWLMISAKGFQGKLHPDSTLDRQQFHRGAEAADRSDRFIYNPRTGSLSFDPDGTGPRKSIEFVQLSRNLALTPASIYIIN